MIVINITVTMDGEKKSPNPTSFFLPKELKVLIFLRFFIVVDDVRRHR